LVASGIVKLLKIIQFASVYFVNTTSIQTQVSGDLGCHITQILIEEIAHGLSVDKRRI